MNFWKNFLINFKKIDWVIFISSFLLVTIGLMSIYSFSLGRKDFFNFQKQIVFFVLGLIFMFTLSFFNWRVLRDSPYFILILYSICLILLIAVLFLAAPVRGVRSWFKLGPVSIDPIEFTKIILIILLAKYFSKRHIEMYMLRHIFFSGIYVLFPAILIIRQPNLGSALILIALWLGLLVISGIKLRHFLLLVFCGVLIFMMGWSFFLKEYQKDRIIGFFAPQIEPLGINWNQNQAEIAIGSGGILGQGFGKGSQTQYGFLPEAHTDFIFSAISEEFGLVGVLVLFFLYIILIWRIIKIALESQSNFPRLFASGFAIVLIAQFFINIGMNLGFLPIIGVSLPLVSYGGGGLIASFISLGILQSIKTS